MPDIRHCDLHENDGQTSYVRSVAQDERLAMDPLVRAAAIDEAGNSLERIYKACGIPDTDRTALVKEFRTQLASNGTRKGLQETCRTIAEVEEIFPK